MLQDDISDTWLVLAVVLSSAAGALMLWSSVSHVSRHEQSDVLSHVIISNPPGK